MKNQIEKFNAEALSPMNHEEMKNVLGGTKIAQEYPTVNKDRTTGEITVVGDTD
ncbi:hypothetical protein SAMN06265348_12020 [Pedobacter westerhofensis]|uniref:Uncharacterized protein n=1 Tax=Pedobacter westerhofensis TaxID=425512 RepID=A0A521FSE8_9SPHI|nr:hypothetical protein [Pedobacter westerhofensis]SMO99143.1 hypothetical protein SAMN06265348_12020 [Pedobacter westerhofensis]